MSNLITNLFVQFLLEPVPSLTTGQGPMLGSRAAARTLPTTNTNLCTTMKVVHPRYP